ncbi:MAG TPA: hypothetical protein VNA20_17330 [Frankiaceae bacterium]|nr:hypothetical protein [Frankiaceae bacterium]
MKLRPLAVAVAFLAVGAATPAEAAPTYRLDGRRTKTQTYRATLSTPFVPVSTAASVEERDPTIPDTEGCTYTPASCDLRTLRLSLPKGTSRGQFRATVVVPSTLNAALVLYSGKTQVDEIWRERQTKAPPECCDVESYTLEVTVARLPAGTYTLAVVDRAGVGEFTATVEWVAHPPDRK